MDQGAVSSIDKLLQVVACAFYLADSEPNMPWRYSVLSTQ